MCRTCHVSINKKIALAKLITLNRNNDQRREINVAQIKRRMVARYAVGADVGMQVRHF